MTTPYKANFYLSIYDRISNGRTNKQIMADLNISKQRLQYYLKTLKQQGYIIKAGYGTWQITGKKPQSKNLMVTTDTPFKESKNLGKIRGHNFMFVLKLPEINRWNKRQQVFDRIGLEYQPLRKSQKLIINGKKTHIFDKSIVVYDNHSYINNSPSNAKYEAIQEFLGIIRYIERRLSVNLRINSKYQYRIAREHYSDMRNVLAKDLNSKRQKLRIKDKKGDTWALIDNSLNLNEMETIKAGESEADMQGLKSWFNSQKRTGWVYTPDFVLNELMPILQQIGINLKEHLKAVKGINKGLAKYGTAINEFNTNIKQKRLSRWLK